ncbi:MAG: response regulator transcription factor [Sphingobacteriales bacterium]|nr:MAG: response regulator transcription factor [Sphingobacteriales bacterium]
MSKIRVGIVENDFIISETLAALVQKMGHEVAGIAVNEAEGIAMLDIQRPDIALLDINLNKEHGGIEVARHIRSRLNMPFIFVTGNSDKATINMAKETNPDAYLLKPFREQDIETSIEIAMHNFRQRILMSSQERPSIFIKHNGEHQRLFTDEILYVESRHVYVSIALADKEILVRASLGEFYDNLSNRDFIKTHRSFVVNIHHIQRFDGNFVYIGKHKIPISKTYLPALEAIFKGL